MEKKCNSVGDCLEVSERVKQEEMVITNIFAKGDFTFVLCHPCFTKWEFELNPPKKLSCIIPTQLYHQITE